MVVGLWLLLDSGSSALLVLKMNVGLNAAPGMNQPGGNGGRPRKTRTLESPFLLRTSVTRPDFQ
jgi:hypothetical protein